LSELLTVSDPRVEFERRYAYMAVETAIARGDPEIILRGPRGTGKTLLMCDLLYRLAIRFPGITQTWLRETKTLMETSVIAAFEDEILGIGHPLRASGRSREGRNGYDIGNGSRIDLMGMDNPDRTKSISTDIIWVNECNALTEREWEELGAANRERVGISKFHLQVKLGDCNPMPESHWTNARCETFPERLYPRVPDDGSRMGEWLTKQMYAETAEWNLQPFDREKHKTKMIVSVHADNPGYWAIDPWGWKPPGMKYARDKLGPLGGHLRKRYLEGRPVSPEGVVFPTFHRDIHCCKDFPAGVPATWPGILSEDPGFDHPTAIAAAVVAPNSRIYFVGEMVKSSTTIEEDALWISGFERSHKFVIRRKLGDPHYMFSEDKKNNGISVASKMAALGHVFESAPAAKNGAELDAQVQLIRTGLDTLLEDGKPAIQFIEDKCPMLIAAMESHPFKRNTRGEITGKEDQYSELYKDEIDAVRMIVASKPKFKVEGARSMSAPKPAAVQLVNGRRRVYDEDEDD
jgi:hypothetical protein